LISFFLEEDQSQQSSGKKASSGYTYCFSDMFMKYKNVFFILKISCGKWTCGSLKELRTGYGLDVRTNYNFALQVAMGYVLSEQDAIMIDTRNNGGIENRIWY